MSDEDDFFPETVLFDEPRPLADAERALVEWLVGQTTFPELREQLATVRAVGYCNCGCPSVELETDGPAVPADSMRGYNEPLTAVRPARDDWFEVRAEGPNAEGRVVDVVLHVPGGRMSELEVWTRDTKRTASDLPVPGVLTLV